MRLTWVIHISYGFCRGFHLKKRFMMFFVTSLFFKTQMILLRSIIIKLSLRPNKISLSSKAFPPHHLSATSLHFLNILHTKWAFNEFCLPNNAMNLPTPRGLQNTFHILGHQQCHYWECNVIFELHLGDKVLSLRIQSLEDILGEVHEKFNDSLRKSLGKLKNFPKEIQ
jgi:hypothetical protein